MSVFLQSFRRLQRATCFDLINQPSQSTALLGLSGFILLLPFGRLSELGVLLCLISSAAYLLSRRAYQVPKKPALRAALTCWAAIFAAALISCVDSTEIKSSLTATIGAIRFAALIIAAAQLNAAQRIFLGKLVAIILGIWCFDALLQALSGFSLGGRSYGDRISGIFGDENLKLGLILATLVPIALFVAQQFKAAWLHPELKFSVLIAVWLVFATVILLAGARAGWVMFALVSLLWGLRLSHYQWRKALLGLAIALTAAISLAALLNATNSRFAQRVNRTMAIFDVQTADFALAGRVPIWHTALRMVAAHPINGVGVRAFRYAYPEFAQPGDPWVHTIATGNAAEVRAIGASHPHQIFLEILTETGLIGLTLWVIATSVLILAWRDASPEQRGHAWPYGCALLVLVFPINTHTALYSSFWASIVWWLVALLSANLDGADELTVSAVSASGPDL